MFKHSARLRALSDQDLESRIRDLVRQEREDIADIVEHLMEVDRRGIAFDQGYSSLFEYCVKKLGYSEYAAYGRIRAARVSAKFPDILDRLRSGRLHLDSLIRLSPHLTEDNEGTLLDIAEGAPPRDVVAPVAAPPPPRGVESTQVFAEALARPLHRFHFTADGELLSAVERLRGYLRHKFPEGKLEDIFLEACKALLELQERKRALSAKRSAVREGSNSAGSGRKIPMTVQREVWARDGGRCAYVSPDGRRCESQDALEYDHIVPWAEGGRSDQVENIRLLCRAHNQRLARLQFGPWRGRQAT